MLALLGLVTAGLGIADLLYSRTVYCNSDDFETPCSTPPGTKYSYVLTFTWISAGIWGGALVRITDSLLRILHHVITKAQQVLRYTTIAKQC